MKEIICICGSESGFCIPNKEAVIEAYKRVASLGEVPQHFKDNVVLFLENPQDHEVNNA